MRRILIMLGVLGLGAGQALAEPIGFFAALRGDVRVASGSDAFAAAVQDGEVSIGDRIRTAEGAGARIVLVDDTMLHVDEDTEIEIERFHVGVAATKERSIVRQTRGRLRTLVGDAFGAETRLEIHTPTAVVGVKGTDFETSDASLPGRMRWQMCLHGGGIVVHNGFGSASPHPGHCVRVERHRAPGPGFPNPAEPFEGPGDPAVDGEDFEEEIVLRGPDGPDLGDDEDELQELGTPPPPASRGRLQPPSIVSLP